MKKPHKKYIVEKWERKPENLDYPHEDGNPFRLVKIYETWAVSKAQAINNIKYNYKRFLSPHIERMWHAIEAN